LPAPPEALAAFLTERAQAGLTFGTLDGYCSGIAHRHHQEGFTDPPADVVVQRVRRGLRRIMGVAPRRQAHPLTPPEVTQIVSAVGADTAIGVRDRAVILLGYASALRPGELPLSTPATSSRSHPESSSPFVTPRPIKTHADNSSEWPAVATV
jgi:integrase